MTSKKRDRRRKHGGGPDTATVMASNKVGLFAWSLLLATACVETLELGETDGSGTTSAAEDVAASESAVGGPDVGSGGGDWIVELSQQRCEALFTCGCPDQEFFGDLDTCVETQVAWLNERRAVAMGSFAAQRSQSCYEALLGRADVDRCNDLLPPASAIEESAAAFCALFIGSALEGEACVEPNSPFQDDSVCAEGLRCRAGQCVRRPTEGEACLETDLLPCADAEACIDEMCQPRRELFEPCERAQCEVELWCVDGLCVPRGAAGESCERGWECASQICTDTQCEAPGSAVCGPYVYEEQ